MLGPGRVGVYYHSFGHTTDILRTKDRTLQTEEPDTTDKEPDILRTSYGQGTGHPTDILRTRNRTSPDMKEPPPSACLLSNIAAVGFSMLLDSKEQKVDRPSLRVCFSMYFS